MDNTIKELWNSVENEFRGFLSVRLRNGIEPERYARFALIEAEQNNWSFEIPGRHTKSGTPEVVDLMCLPTCETLAKSLEALEAGASNQQGEEVGT